MDAERASKSKFESNVTEVIDKPSLGMYDRAVGRG